MNSIIPEAALAQHIAVLGKTGSGKTFAAKAAIVEPLLARNKRVGIVDPTGAWWGLRSSRDGKGAGFPILVLGGDHGDLPLPALGGAAVARLLAEQGVNLVADTSQLTVGERTRWFIDFASALYRANRTPLHLVIDEAHNFAPQGKVPDPDTGKMLHAANTLASGGRSRGIRLVMITQRPQKLHKDTLTSADTLIAMRVLAPHDRSAVEDWIKGCGDMGAGKEVLNSLASLQRGEGWIWYPEGAHLIRAKFPNIKTFDSSATPTDGHAATAPKGAAEIDLAEIKAALADAVREAEANDPKLLRAEIARLKREAAKPTAAAKAIEKIVEKEVEVPVLKDSQLARAEKLLERLQENGDRFLAEAIELRRIIGASQAPWGRVAAARTSLQSRAAPAGSRAAPAQRHNGSGAEGISRSQQRILDALAWLEAAGIAQPTKDQLALWAEVSPTSGGYFNNLGALRSAGLIEYPAGGSVALTDVGRARSQVSAPPTVEEMQESVCRKVGNSKAAILRTLIDIYPKDISKDDLAEKIDVSPTSGGYFNNLGALRTLGVIGYPSPGCVAALPILFLE
jgi:uncharacterized protein